MRSAWRVARATGAARKMGHGLPPLHRWPWYRQPLAALLFVLDFADAWLRIRGVLPW